MPRTPKAPPKTEQPQKGAGRSPGSKATQFKPGRKKTGGRVPKADVWKLLQQAAELANEQAVEDGGEPIFRGAEHFYANLVSTVQRLDPATALRVMTPHIVPKAQYKPVDIGIDHDDPEGTLQRIATAMASGGDMAALNLLFQTVKATMEARALALEMRALERELGE
ncbi:hypothetical protein KE423_003894 [Salmonella enterica]|nr:hypothetical protein [Salmonella enterica]